jgi:hypothetical protein
MTPADVLWLFFLLSALQPGAKQQYLEASRDLLSLYPQPVHRQPAVEYLPEHRRFEGIQQPRP